MANNYRYYTIEYQFINGRLLPNGKKIYNLGYMQQGDSYTNVLRVKIPDEYSSSVGSVLVNVQRPDKTKVANGLYLTYNAVDGYYERKLERWFTEMSGQYDLDVSVVQATSIDSGEEDEFGEPIMVSPLDMAGRVTYYVNESSYAEVGEELLPAVEDEFRTAISSLDASKIYKDGTNSDIGSIAFQTDIEQTVAEGEIGYDNSDNEFHFGKSDGGVDKFSNKVDKVEGKALSTNDYTDLEQTKLGTIEENAEVNIIEVVKDSASTPLEVASEDRSVTLTKSVVGLGNVDNTSDTDKPISTSQQGALDTKPSIATFDGATGTVSFYKETSLSGGETPLFTVDLPTEALVVSGAYDAETEIITLTLANGSTIEIDASGLINANELVDAIATKLGLDFSALNAMGAIDTANDLVAVRDVSGTAETKKVSVKDLVESAGVMKDISQLDSATIDDTDYMLVGEGSVPKKTTVGALKNHLKTPISIETTNTERIESTYGLFVPHVDGAPLIKEIQGLTVGASQLTLDTPIAELNGNTLREVFEDGNLAPTYLSTEWKVLNGKLEKLETSLNILNATTTSASIYSNSQIGVGNTNYFRGSIKTDGIGITNLQINDGITSSAVKSNPIQNVWYDISAIDINNQSGRIYLQMMNGFGYNAYFKDIYRIDMVDLGIDTLTVDQMDYYYSLYQELIDLDGGLPAQYSNDIYTNDDVIIYGTPLVTAKQYSPMFDTTFDLMSEANIKSQFDLWVQENILPHALQSLTNATIKSVGKNLFDKSAYETDYALKIHVKPSQELFWAVSTAYKLYDNDNVEIASGTSNSVTTTANTKYIAFSGIANVDTFQLEQGTVATAYEPYKSETQVFNATIRSAVDNGTIRDKIRYDNGKYVIDRYVDTSTGLALATPLLANETVDVDGTIIQDSVTTLYQEQDLSTVYKVEWSMNAEQSVVTLVQRDKMQQEEIDDLETKMSTAQGDIVTLDGEAVKTVQIGDNTAMTPTANKITIPLAVPTGEGQTDGAMTHEDKAKLDGMEDGAQVNVLEGVQVNGVDLVPTSKKVNVDISSKVDKIDGKQLSDENYTAGEKGIVNYIGSTVEQELVVIDADDIKSLSLTDGDETSTLTIGNSMGSVEVGDDDNIYVSNTIIGTPNENQVKKLNRNYEEQFTISLGAYGINAMCIFGGHVYIAYTVSSSSHIIKRYSIVDGAEDTTYTHSTNLIGASETAAVKRIKFDKEGNLFYTCTGYAGVGATLVKLDPSGKELLRVIDGMGSRGLAIDNDGNAIYSAGVPYTSYKKIFKINGKTGANIWTSADLGGYSDEIVVDSNDDIILSSAFMETAFVKKLSKVDGSVLWTASGFSNYTNKVTIDADDNVYTRDGYDVIKLSKTDGAELWSVTLLGEVRDIAMLSLEVYKKLDFIDATKDMVKPISIATSQVLEKFGMELPTDFKLYPYTFYYQTLTANYQVASLEEYENIYLRKWHFGVANASVAYSVSFVPTIKWETALPTFAINTIYEFEIIKVGTTYIGKWRLYA